MKLFEIQDDYVVIRDDPYSFEVPTAEFVKEATKILAKIQPTNSKVEEESK